MLVELIYHVVLWLSTFLTKTGVSKVLFPCEIVFCQKLDFAKNCQAVSGLYCKVHNKLTPINRMVTQTTPAIVLNPTGILHGTYKFYNFITGKKIKKTYVHALSNA